MKKAWERMTEEGESPQDYQDFLIYRDLGPHRTLDSAYAKKMEQREGGSGASKRPSGRFTSSSRKFDWVKRCDTWDAHLQARRDRAAADFAARWEVRRLEAVEKAWEMADVLHERFENMMTFPLKIQKASKDGKTIHIHPARWNYQTVALLAKTICDLRSIVLASTTKPIGEYSDLELKAIRDAHDVPEADGDDGR